MQWLATAQAGTLPSHLRAPRSLVLQIDRVFDSVSGGPPSAELILKRCSLLGDAEVQIKAGIRDPSETDCGQGTCNLGAFCPLDCPRSLFTKCMESCVHILASQELPASTLFSNSLVGSRHCDLGL